MKYSLRYFHYLVLNLKEKSQMSGGEEGALQQYESVRGTCWLEPVIPHCDSK